MPLLTELGNSPGWTRYKDAAPLVLPNSKEILHGREQSKFGHHPVWVDLRSSQMGENSLAKCEETSYQRQHIQSAERRLIGRDQKGKMMHPRTCKSTCDKNAPSRQPSTDVEVNCVMKLVSRKCLSTDAGRHPPTRWPFICVVMCLFVTLATAGACLAQAQQVVGFALRGKWPQLSSARGSDIKVVGRYAYLATDSLGLQIFDVADVTNPLWVGSGEPTGGSLAVDVVGNRAIVAGVVRRTYV